MPAFGRDIGRQNQPGKLTMIDAIIDGYVAQTLRVNGVKFQEGSNDCIDLSNELKSRFSMLFLASELQFTNEHMNLAPDLQADHRSEYINHIKMTIDSIIYQFAKKLCHYETINQATNSITCYIAMKNIRIFPEVVRSVLEDFDRQKRNIPKSIKARKKKLEQQKSPRPRDLFVHWPLRIKQA